MSLQSNMAAKGADAVLNTMIPYVGTEQKYRETTPTFLDSGWAKLLSGFPILAMCGEIELSAEDSTERIKEME